MYSKTTWLIITTILESVLRKLAFNTTFLFKDAAEQIVLKNEENVQIRESFQCFLINLYLYIQDVIYGRFFKDL
jgi:hypothetical protein